MTQIYNFTMKLMTFMKKKNVTIFVFFLRFMVKFL